LTWLSWLAYVLLPVEAAMVDGIPVGRADAVALLLVGWIAVHRVRIPGAWLAAAAAVAAGALSAAAPGEPGLHARYYAAAVPGGAHERSTEYDDPDYTRVDPRLAFTRGTRDFPLAFFNDHARFNFLHGEKDRRLLEFAVAWSGWWRPRAGTHVLYLHAPGARAEVSLDGEAVLTLDGGPGPITREVTLADDWQRLHVTFASPYGSPREFSAGVVVDGRLEPFGGGDVRTRQIDDRQRLAAAVLATGKPIADVVALTWLGGLAGLLLLRHAGELWQQRSAALSAATALVVAAGALEALRFAWPWAARLRVLAAGDDPMTYEAYARDILLNGPLMNGGAHLGQAEPFYYQAFYPYFLAAAHALFGESMFGVLLLQRLFVALSAVALTWIAVRLWGRRVWPVALVLSLLFAGWKFAPIAADLLNESLYVPLLLAWTLALLHTGHAPSLAGGAVTGILGGLAAITRSTAMLSWLVFWPLAAWTWRERRAAVPVMVACSLAALLLVGVRNLLVSGDLVFSPTGGGVTLLGGNDPPDELALNPAPRRALYQWLGAGPHAIEVMEYALAAPRHFAANLGRKALFALGVYEPYAPGWGWSPVFLATWIAGLAGVALIWRAGGDHRPAALVPLILAATQFVAVVVIYPKGERLILPIHIVLVPYAAITAHQLVARLVEHARVR
jgi:hypothetical protein